MIPISVSWPDSPKRCQVSKAQGFKAGSIQTQSPVCVSAALLTAGRALGQLPCPTLGLSCLTCKIHLFHHAVGRSNWGHPCQMLTTLPGVCWELKKGGGESPGDSVPAPSPIPTDLTQGSGNKQRLANRCHSGLGSYEDRTSQKIFYLDYGNWASMTYFHVFFKNE